MDSLKSGFNPLSLLGNAAAGGAAGLDGVDPMQLLMALFGGASAAGQGQNQDQVCSCGGGGQSGACSCGGNCCQKNQALGF